MGSVRSVSLRTWAFAVGIFLILTWTFTTFTGVTSGQHADLRYFSSKSTAVSNLHLVIPATSGNHHLCQLLLSATILGYPSPTLINWGVHEDQDDYVQHLAKVEGILNYLNALPEGSDNDLFLMVDGYDAWFQLPPEILVERYRSMVAQSGQRYPHLQVQDTVIFGQDKLCWPGAFSRPACWAVPESTIPNKAFGPDTDHGIAEHNRPRWLNSGTILGPVKDVRDVFAATLKMIQMKHTENSDQYYFANLFAEQSYARGPHQGQQWPVEVLPNGEALEYPEVFPDQRTEWGIGIDYESAIFQTVAYYEDYITFALLNRSTAVLEQGVERYYRNLLPNDLLSSSPTDLLKDLEDRAPDLEAGNLKALRSWSTVPLAINTITKQVFPLLHFTGKKGYREMWWHRNWFYPHAEYLLRHQQNRALDGATSHETQSPGVGGVWTTAADNQFLSWEGLCGRYEDYLFGRP